MSNIKVKIWVTICTLFPKKSCASPVGTLKHERGAEAQAGQSGSDPTPTSEGLLSVSWRLNPSIELDRHAHRKEHSQSTEVERQGWSLEKKYFSAAVADWWAGLPHEKGFDFNLEHCAR